MSFPHCETCRFWGTSDEIDEEFRSCTAVVRNNGIRTETTSGQHGDREALRILGRPRIGERERRERDQFKAVVQDASDYHAALVPRRDFGCVLHQERTRGGER